MTIPHRMKLRKRRRDPVIVGRSTPTSVRALQRHRTIKTFQAPLIFSGNHCPVEIGIILDRERRNNVSIS
jgi:hypothetical protein